MSTTLNCSWPVLTHYEGEHRRRVALPMGGIGTGTVSLGGRGNLQDWEIMNRPGKGFDGGEPLFVLYAKREGHEPVMRVLEGAILPPYEGFQGLAVPYHGLPRFRQCCFDAAYPFAQVSLADSDVPVDVRLEAFNPFVPADADESGIPVAILRYVLRNKTPDTVHATVCGSIKNYIGFDGQKGRPAGNVNAYCDSDNVRGLLLSSTGVGRLAEQWGTIALATTAEQVSYKRSWSEERRKRLLHFWDDLSEDGRLDDVPHAAQDDPMASLAAQVSIPPFGQQKVTFLLAWHFPNRYTWTPSLQNCCQDQAEGSCDCSEDRVGNYYTTQYRDAWDVAERVADALDDLEEHTIRFVQAFLDSDLPKVVKEAALYNLSTLRTQTCFRTEDGRFFGWEGCRDDSGSCLGSCTHVWNYEQATAFLFGELSRSLRDTEFMYATKDSGHMSFRVHLPLNRSTDHGWAAADGQMGCIMKMYRDWQLSGDDAMLRSLWPRVRKAIEFCWIPGGWDEDQDGVMEGCQHNTLDVEYFGPNPLMSIWYLGALRAAEEMGSYQGDEQFADKCRALFQRGSAWLDAHLFNGDYYEQEIRPPKEGQLIAEGLRSTMGAKDLRDPDYQVGTGCLIDQLVGQFTAHVCGLGYLVDVDHITATLRSLLRYNLKQDMHDHFNHYRTYALNDEEAMVMCSFPRGARPKTPVHFYSEVMTGFEYAAAIHMLYEGMLDEGLHCIEAVRARYDGARRNPFSEAECGHHYARAMASWAAVPALTGFRYSGVTATMTFAHKLGRHFWSTGDAWGTCDISNEDKGIVVTLAVLGGTLKLRRMVVTGAGAAEMDLATTMQEGESVTLAIVRTP